MTAEDFGKREGSDGTAASTLDRRAFLQVIGLGGAGFVLGCGDLLAGESAPAGAAGTAVFNAFVRVASDDTVTVVIKHLDKGQGVTTGLTTIVAEEMDAAWAQMRWEFAPADATRYNNLAWGPVQGTGGSSSIRNSWMQLREAGGAARAMLVEAAATAWGVPASEITVAAGRVRHASGRAASFGELATAAARQQPPADVRLKAPGDFTLIGTHIPRIDTPEKTSGRAQYTIDVTRPGMLTAVIARPPVIGARLAGYDATRTRQVAGVTDVVATPRGVAVVADTYWAAQNGRRALKIDWDTSAADLRSSGDRFAEYRRRAGAPGAIARSEGDVETVLDAAAKTIERVFEFPYLAHATMEPMNAIVELHADRCEIWTAAQTPTMDQNIVAGITGLAPAQVRIHTLFAGGSFGRRAVAAADYIAEAVMVATAIGRPVPLKLQWSREDDLQGGRYRPMTLHVLRGGLDRDGNIIAWSHRIVSQSILKGTPLEGKMQDGIDGTAVEGARGLPYAIANLRCDLHLVEGGISTLWWRSVGHTHNGFATEVFFDELVAAAGRDPVAERRRLLAGHPRHLGVLDTAVARAGSPPTGKGRGRGVAVHESFKSYVAEVADVTVHDDGSFKVDRVVCAVDCGIAVNPDIVRAQMEGGIGFGLGAALREEITIAGGAVEQTNFDTYRPLRMADMPAVAVHIVPSAEPPSGVGEPGVPPIAPAVANALRAVTGKVIHRLPIGDRLPA